MNVGNTCFLVLVPLFLPYSPFPGDECKVGVGSEERPQKAGVLGTLHSRVGNVPPNEVFGVVPYPNVVREIETVLPIDYFPVYVPPVLCAKRGPADKALKHDCAERPLCASQIYFMLSRRKMRYSRTQSQSNEYPFPVRISGAMSVTSQYLVAGGGSEMQGQSYNPASQRQSKPSACATFATR